MSEIEIRYLDTEEKSNCIPLCRQCFPEDSEVFVDYYYREKCKDNRVAALYEDGRLAAMAHANPFTVSLCGQLLPVNYIVSVATDAAYRGQGYMRGLMVRVLRDCRRRGEPFSFLMPANPAYYTSLGYRYWDSQIEWKLLPGLQDGVMRWIQEPDVLPDLGKGRTVRALSKEEYPILADFTNRLLKERFDLFIWRDAAYYARLKKEQISEFGDVAVVRDQAGALLGSLCGSNEGRPEIREPIVEGCVQEEIRPFLMGRIVHLENFVRQLRFREPYTRTVSVVDDIIPENNGRYRIEIDASGGRIEPDRGRSCAPDLHIGELGKELFGRMRIFINELV